MSVQHTCFLDMAKHSLTLNGEMWTRNAISRAYYSTYHSVLRVTNNSIPISNQEGEKLKGGVHMRLCTMFCSGEAAAVRNVDISIIKRLGVKLKMMHSQRVKADYKLDHKINRITAISTINDSEEIDKIVNQLLNISNEPSN